MSLSRLSANCAAGPRLQAGAEADRVTSTDVPHAEMETRRREGALRDDRRAVVGAAPDIKDAECLQRPDRFTHGRARRAEFLGQIALRRESVSDFEIARRDGFVELVDDRCQRSLPGLA